ncbi:MAG: SurA N-terminal domain-containing protein [Desulfovermiculus sp.]
MLESIRNNAQSWGVKLLFAIIVLVFVFWGVGSFRDSGRQVVAEVDGQEIGMQEFVQKYQQQVEALRREQGDISSEQLKDMDLKRQVLEGMISQRLIQAKAEELGLVVGSGQVRSRIRGMQVFHGDNDTFDPNRYQGLLRMNNLTPAQFEADIRMDLVSSALREMVTAPVRVEASEARALFEYVQARALIEYVQFPVQDYVQQVEMDEEEIREYYQEHKQEYRVPAKMSMQVIRVNPETLADSQDVSSEEVKAYYENNEQEFTQEEQIKARHILIEVDEEAGDEEVEKARQEIEKAAKRLEQGADFDQLAGEVSEAPSADQGGDLGWFGRNSMAEAFEEEAFALQPGEISDPVRTKFGFHLIQVTDRREDGVQPLDQVQEEIRSRLAQEKAVQKLEDRLDDVLQIVLTEGDIHQAADAVNLEVEKIGPFGRGDLPEGLNLEDDQVNRLMQMQVGEITETPFSEGDGYLIAKKTEHEESFIPEQDQVRDQVRSALEKVKARELAQKEAQEALKELENGQSAEDLGLKVETSQPFARQGNIPGLGKNQELFQDVFAASEGQWLDTSYDLREKVIIAKLLEIEPPDNRVWEEQKEYWVDSMRRLQEQLLFDSYVQGLREAADITIQSPEALRYS